VLAGGGVLRLFPVAPRMRIERVLAQRRQLGHQLLANRVGERGGHPHVVERARVVVETEQQGADQRARAFLVPAESRHHAVGGALVLTLTIVRSPARYGASRRLAMTPSSPAPSKRWNQSSATPRSRVAGERCTRGAVADSARSRRSRRSVRGRS